MEEFEANNCSCLKCRTMCLTSPCFPTPEDADRLIKAGYEDMLQTTYFGNIHAKDESEAIFKLVAPRSEKKTAITAQGIITLHKCIFLDENGLCKLHDLGLKPTEGRLASCKRKHEDTFKLRIAVCNTWKKSELGSKIMDFYE